MHIAIIGAGRVGSLIAYSIAARNIVDRITLVDVMSTLAEGQAIDLTNAFIDRSIEISAGDYNNINDSDIIVITAGRPRQPGQTRADLAKINGSIAAGIAHELPAHNNRIIITVANPTDTINHILYTKTNYPRQCVIGSTSMLDTSRLKTVLAQKYGCNGNDIDAIMIGEHGEFQLPHFSGIRLKGRKLDFTEGEMEQIRNDVRKSAISVIEKKKATEYAPALFTTDLIESIVKNQKKTMQCSCILDGEYGLTDLSIGVPAVIGRKGVEKIIELKLSDYERNIFEKGAASIKECIALTQRH